MRNDELAEAIKQRDSFKHRIELMEDGKLETRMGSPCDIDTTALTLQQAKQSIAALERKIAKLQDANVLEVQIARKRPLT